jgi:adenylate kinase
MTQSEIIVLLGKPGCGKGTQTPKILSLQPNNSECISTGAIYRGAKTPDGIYGQFYPRIQPYIDSVDHHGKLLPNEIIVPIVGEILQLKVGQGINRFIFDGFPRNIGQLDEVDKMFRRYDFKSLFIYFKLFDKIALQRVESRRQLALINHGPIRAEDQPKTAKLRLQVFSQETKPMINKLKTENRLITIKAYRTIEEIAEITRRKIF